MSVIQAGVLSAALCADLCSLYDDRVHLSKHKDYSGWPVLYWEQVRAHAPDEVIAIKTLTVDIPVRIARSGQGWHLIETILMAALGPGGHHIAHADNRTLDGKPNHTPQRSFSAIVYLNNEFMGGELDFPDRGEQIEPHAGLMVAFPSDYVHQVLPVTAGKRYSLNLWFTQDPKRELRL